MVWMVHSQLRKLSHIGYAIDVIRTGGKMVGIKCIKPVDPQTRKAASTSLGKL
jgi:hypothetical protein